MTDNTDWQRAIGKHRTKQQPWLVTISTYLADLGWVRRSADLPEAPDENGQCWPLWNLTSRTLAMLDAYTDPVEHNTAMSPEIVANIQYVQHQAQSLWKERRKLAASEGIPL